jgi:hypothetical protein
MSKVILEKELGLIRRRLAIEEALVEDKASLQEALREHRAGRSIAFKPTRSRPRRR